MESKRFEDIYRRHYAAMYRLAKAMLYDTDESHDVVDEVFTRLLQGNMRPTADKLEGWLMTSVRNRCRDIIRQKTLKERVHALYAIDMAQEASAANIDERLEQLATFIDTQLPPVSRRIFRLRFLQGMSYEDVARAVGVSRVTVWNHLVKATGLLSEHFKNQKRNE